MTKVIVGKDTLTTTPNHPFYVPTEVNEADGSHWLQAGVLRKGAMILLASGIMASVDTAYTYAASERVYNFEIAEHHNYYVGESGVLVHNDENCIVEYLKRVLIYEYGLTVPQVTTLLDDILPLPNGQNILLRISKGEIHPKAYSVVKKHAPTKVGDEDILASITTRAKKDNDLKLFDDLENPHIFQAYLTIRNNPGDPWDFYGELKEILGDLDPPQKVPATLINYAQSKQLLNNGEAGRIFEEAIIDLLDAKDAALKNAISLKLQKMGLNIKLSDYTFVKKLQIYLGKKADGSPLYCIIDCAYVRDIDNGGKNFEVIPIDAKHSIDAPATTNQKIWLDQLGNTRDFTTHQNNSSYKELKDGSNIEIKATLRIDGPIGNYQVNQFIKK